MVLIKLNNVLRMTAYVGIFVTAIFYLTRKVMIVYILAMIVNFVSIIYVLLKEKDIAEDYDKIETDDAKEKYEKMLGSSPAVLLWFNMILPILFIPTFFVLYGQTGLILHDNDKIAQNETDFLSGKQSNPGA